MTSQSNSLPPVLLIDEVAGLLRTSTRTVRRKLRAGTFPLRPVRSVDRTLRFLRADVERFLQGKRSR